jgi:hypothetical protein
VCLSSVSKQQPTLTAAKVIEDLTLSGVLTTPSNTALEASSGEEVENNDNEMRVCAQKRRVVRSRENYRYSNMLLRCLGVEFCKVEERADGSCNTQSICKWSYLCMVHQLLTRAKRTASVWHRTSGFWERRGTSRSQPWHTPGGKHSSGNMCLSLTAPRYSVPWLTGRGRGYYGCLTKDLPRPFLWATLA